MTLKSNVTFKGSASYLEYKTNGPYFTYLNPGVYLFEVWGAQGGCLNESSSAKGGYSRGILYLRWRTKTFINVGQNGFCVTQPSIITSFAYNGGGCGKTATPIFTFYIFLLSLSSLYNVGVK